MPPLELPRGPILVPVVLLAVGVVQPIVAMAAPVDTAAVPQDAPTCGPCCHGGPCGDEILPPPDWRPVLDAGLNKDGRPRMPQPPPVR